MSRQLGDRAALPALLTDLLKRAEAAHLEHEREHGPTEWPQFYAAHLVRVFGDDPYSYDDLLAALLAAARMHHFYEVETGGPHAEWAEWYADHMADTLTRNWFRVRTELDTVFDI